MVKSCLRSVLHGYAVLSLSCVWTIPCYAPPESDSWYQKINTAVATTAGFVGRHVVKHVVFGVTPSYNALTNGVVTLASASGYLPQFIDRCVQGTFLAMSAYPVFQAAQHGEAAF